MSSRRQHDIYILSKIRDQIYANANVDNHIIDLQGWMPSEFITLFTTVIKSIGKCDPKVIEVGSWKGLSANNMARICKENGATEAIITCVDTWLGSPEHMEGESASFGMKRINGVPAILDVFVKNAKKLQNDDVIFPFPMSSFQAGEYFIRKNYKADIIYIDAGHEYDAVYLDIKLYWNVLKEGGYMILDDYNWPGVRKAIDEFFKDVKFEVIENQVLVHKPLTPLSQQTQTYTNIDACSVIADTTIAYTS